MKLSVTFYVSVAIIFCSVFSAIAKPLQAQSEAQQAINDARAASEEAFSALSDADRAGANVTALIAEFNRGLDLLDRATVELHLGAYDEALELAKEAALVFRDIPSNAERAHQDANARAQPSRYITYALVPTIPSAIAFAFYLGLRSWKISDSKRTLKMKIKLREVPEKGED